MVDESPLDVVARAESYPYGLAETALRLDLDAVPSSGTTAVVAIGSHVAAGAGLPAPVSARLRNHAVVYAATVARTGSVPATVVDVPGATSLVPVVFVPSDDLERLQAGSLAEGDELVDVSAALELPLPGSPLALAPRSRFGPLHVNERPLRLAELPTVGTRFGAAYQGGLLALVHLSCAGPGESYGAFVRDLATSPGRRAEVRHRLAMGLHTRRRG